MKNLDKNYYQISFINYNFRKKLTIRIVELEETISSLTIKIQGVEKQKSRLSQEIEIMILDLEKVINFSLIIFETQNLFYKV